MSLAVRARAGEHGDFAGAFDAHGAALETRAAARFDESRKTNADEFAFLAPLIAQAQKFIVVGNFERFSEWCFIIAGIVLDAGAGGVGELIGLNEILPANLQAIHAEHSSGFVEQPLDVQYRLGSSG